MVHGGDVLAGRHAQQDAGEDVDDHHEAIALGAGDGAQSVDLVRVGGGVTVDVDRPVIGDGTTGALGVEDLAPSLNGGSHVEVHESIVGRGGTEGDGVGAVEGLSAAVRNNHGVGLAHGEAAQVVLGGHLGVVAQSAGVGDALDAHDADAVLLSELHGLLEAQDSEGIAAAVVTVDDAGAGAGLGPGPLGIGGNAALGDALGVVLDTNLAVAVQAALGRPGKHLGGLLGVLLRKAGSHELVLHEGLEFFALDEHVDLLWST